MTSRLQKLFPSIIFIAGTAVVLLFCQEMQFDGRTFFISGRRILDQNWQHLYDPLVGSGPWTYQPQATLLFLPFMVFGTFGYKLFLLSSVFALSLLCPLFYRLSKTISGKSCVSSFSGVAILACIGTLWFPIYESLYLGQIDLWIACAIAYIWALTNARNFRGSGALLGILVTMKPQLVVFLIPVVMFAGWGSVIYMLATWFGSLGIFTIVSGATPSGIVFLFESFYRNTASIVSTAIGPVNQSALSVTQMLFSETSYLGRFCPIWYNPGPLNWHLYAIGTAAARSILILIRAVFGSLLIFTLWRAYKAKDLSLIFAILLFSLPTFSPVFWQVHLVHLLPGLFWLILRVKSLNNSGMMAFLYSSLAIQAVASPLVIGLCRHDMLESYGLSYGIVGLWFILAFISAKLKT